MRVLRLLALTASIACGSIVSAQSSKAACKPVGEGDIAKFKSIIGVGQFMSADTQANTVTFRVGPTKTYTWHISKDSLPLLSSLRQLQPIELKFAPPASGDPTDVVVSKPLGPGCQHFNSPPDKPGPACTGVCAPEYSCRSLPETFAFPCACVK